VTLPHMKHVPTLLYLDVFRFYDASRSGLIEALRRLGIRVVVANFPFHHLSQQDDICESLINLLDKEGINPDAVISMNVAGLSGCFRRFSEARGLARAVWFIDSPYLFTNLTELKHAKVFAASREFETHPEASIERWVPFAGYDPRRPSNDPEANIGFLGTLLPMVYYITRMQKGLVGSKSGHVKLDARFFERVQQPSFTTQETWKASDQWALPAAEILNFASSHHRIRTLSWFEDLGLEITGPSNWQAELWAIHPFLLKNFTVGSIASEKAMREYLSRYRICLNIFHLQNVSGGPNFRSMDAASNYIPCLSQYNEGCAEIFPENVAAVYFRDCDDARYKAKQLLTDASLRQKIANNAAEIVSEGHTFAKRAAEFCAYLNLKAPSNPTKAPLVYLHWPAGAWTRSVVTEKQVEDGTHVVIAQPSLPPSAKPKNRRPLWSRLARSVRKRLSADHLAQG